MNELVVAIAISVIGAVGVALSNAVMLIAYKVMQARNHQTRLASRNAAARQVAHERGLVFTPERDLVGSLDGFPLRIASFLWTGQAPYTRALVQGMPPGLTVERRGASRRPRRRVGDSDFDEAFRVLGDEEMLGWFDEDTRHILQRTTGAFTVEDGVLTLQVDDVLTDAGALWAFIDEALTLARRFRGDLEDQLARTALRDHLPVVRANALRLLDLRNHGRAVAMATELTDHHPLMQVAVARVLRRSEEALSLLTTTDDPQVRMRALEVLDLANDADAVFAGVAFVFALPDAPVLWLRAFDLVDAHRPKGLQDVLRTLAARLAPAVRQDAALRPSVRRLCEAAVLLGLQELEPELIALVATTDDAEAVTAAAEALAVLGTVAAVQALAKTDEQSGIFEGTRDVLRGAIQAIQARSGGESGALSFADVVPGEGALSVADGTPAEGAMSVAVAPSAGPDT